MKVIIEYVVSDGVSPPEVHWWVADGSVTLEEVLEHVDNSCSIVRDSVQIHSASEWDSE